MREKREMDERMTLDGFKRSLKEIHDKIFDSLTSDDVNKARWDFDNLVLEMLQNCEIEKELPEIREIVMRILSFVDEFLFERVYWEPIIRKLRGDLSIAIRGRLLTALPKETIWVI